MALHAGGRAAVLLQPLAQREILGVGFERRHIGRRIVGRFRDDLARHPGPALHRVRFAPIGKPGQNRGLGEHAAQFRALVPHRNKLEAALGLIRETVVAGHGLIRHDEVGRDDVLHRQIVADQVLHELHRLLLQLGAGVAGQLGIELAVHFQHLELIQAQPLRGELIGEPREARIARSCAALPHPAACDSVPACRQLQRLAIRRPVPQEVGELRSQLIAIERLRRRGSCSSRSGTGTAARSATTTSASLTLSWNERPPSSDLRKTLVSAASSALVMRTAVGARGEIVDDLLRRTPADRSCGRNRRRCLVCEGGGHDIVIGPFEFHRPDRQPRHIAPVGVLAAHADFAHAPPGN